MTKRRDAKVMLVVTAAALSAALVLIFPETALAQCPLCKTSVALSEEGGGMAASLNLGILVLLLPPVTIFCSIFFVAFKHRKARGED
ncbi:MAG: hypothetical protein ACRD68_11875 [Pyrinomonadaceae bacterium]